MKVLIFLDENALSPAGGPLGVGYYLHVEAKKENNDNLQFIHTDLSKKLNERKQKKILYKFPHLTKIVRSIRHIKEYNDMFNNPPYKSGAFEDFDAVHFHTTSDMYKQRRNLEKYKGTVLLSSHSPIPLAQELFNACATNFERKYYQKHMKKFEEMDAWSFSHADYLVFPCEEAEEPYFNNWNYYLKIKKNQNGHYRYVLTGIAPRKATLSRNEIRKKYNISENDFVVSFVGRHNEVKGYGKLKQIGSDLIVQDKDIRFLIAGSEGPIEKMINPSWIEVGFTKDPYSLISASDVFVLPNNETYFDLVMIEVLSLGKIVVASRTGGNKYYEKQGLEGVFLFDTVEEAEKLVHSIKNMSYEKRTALERSNLEFYKTHLTGEIFYKNYINMLKNIGINLDK